MTEEVQNLTEDEVVNLTVNTMAGELMKLVIDELKAAPDVWQKLPEIRQRDVIDRVERRVKTAVEQAVHLIASEGRKTIVADLEQMTVKEGVKIVAVVRKGDPNRHELQDAVGQAILIVVGGSEGFMGGTDAVKPEPDQRALDINNAVVTSDDEKQIAALPAPDEEIIEGEIVEDGNDDQQDEAA